MNLIYKGEFYSRENVHWKIHILSREQIGTGNVGMLQFSVDEPLVFEWDDESKEVPLCGSTATLTLISPGDRTYANLYTEDPTALRLDAYRNGVLYWSGCLDPEFYEEPYSQCSNYEVSLTFSDFGALDRLRYDLADMRTLQELVQIALARCNISELELDTTLISSSMVGTTNPLKLSDLMVRSDNFYDEDGEALTLYEVLEGVLQPLALRMVQRGGKVWVYDLNGLYQNGIRKTLKWMSDDQVMGVDKVFNDAKIIWSTYAQSGVLSNTECWVKDTFVDASKAKQALQTVAGVTLADGVRLFSYHYSTDMDNWYDYTDVGFALLTHTEGKGAVLDNASLRFYKIVPMEDGSESEGIAIRWLSIYGYKVGSGSNWYATTTSSSYGAPLSGGKSVSPAGGKLFTTDPISLPPVADPGKLRLRISINMLMDPRYNPFEDATNLDSGLKNKDWFDSYKKYGNFIYVPVTIKFQPSGSDTIYVWTNKSVVERSYNSPIKSFDETMGSWVRFTATKDAAPTEFGYLCWYDKGDRVDTSGVTGWKRNRPAINPHKKNMTTALANAEEGQYIPYPSFGGTGGKLWLEVRNGPWIVRNEQHNLTDDPSNKENNVSGHISWVLMELPEISIQNNDQWSMEIDTDDVEYSAKLNEEAKEDIELDTICGTAEGGVPTARGAYFSSSDYEQITALKRAGRTAPVEQLLIGTLYSQFASRKTRLDGTVEMNGDGVCTYTEASLPKGTLLMMTGTVENAQDDTMEGSFIELRPDEYDKA